MQGAAVSCCRTVHFSALIRALPAVVAAAALAGCAAVSMRVLPESPHENRQLRGVAGEAAQRLLARASNRMTEEQVRESLAAARTAWPEMLRGEESARLIYRAALRRLLRLERDNGWDLRNGPVVARGGPGLLDPSAPDLLVPADQIRIGGVPQRTVTDGLGLPCVAWFRADSPFLQRQPGVPPGGMAVPVTALLTFDNRGGAQWQLVRTLQRDTWPVNGRDRKLAADFSAPLAMAIAKGTNRALDLVSLFLPQEYLHLSGLYQSQPFDHDKTPVVFIHGLMSRPETWRIAVNELLSDPVIRRNYQFWFFLYPTGLPVWDSAARLRGELDRFNRQLATRAVTASQRRRLNSKVLVGHSMGGLVASLQIRQGGDGLWGQLSKVPLSRLPVSAPAKTHIRRMIDFSPRRDVSRVVFAATPHRGSPIALRPGARFFAARVRFALPEIQNYRHLLLSTAHDDVRRDLEAPANSIRFLRENSPLLRAILASPRDNRVVIHSIIGDRGRNDAPAGGDGIVPYASAHYSAAVSEKIVPSGHDVHQHPEGVRELERILRASAGN